MSLIYCSPNGSEYVDLYCPGCSNWVGCEELSVVCDMAVRGIEPYCFDCKPGADRVSNKLFMVQDTFLLGLGDKSFLATWALNGTDDKPETLQLREITQAAWYSLKTGDVRIVCPEQSLSSSPKVITVFLDGGGENA